MDEDDGNGFDPTEEAAEGAAKGAILKVADMRREDGILAQAAQNMTKQNQSVLHRSMTAVNKDSEYRQELKTAFFMSTDEADKVVAAINEADRYGCPRKPIVDWIISRSAGVQGGRFRAILETISHTQFTTNYQQGQKKQFWQRGDKSGDKPGLLS